jgi:homoserine dehydrogenase
MNQPKMIQAAVLGLGNVNQRVLHLLHSKQDELRQNYGLVFQIVAVTDSTGILFRTTPSTTTTTATTTRNTDDASSAAAVSLDIGHLIAHKASGKSVSEYPPHGLPRGYQKIVKVPAAVYNHATSSCSHNNHQKTVAQIFSTLDVDVVFEATPCSATVLLPDSTTTTATTATSEALEIVRDALTRGVAVVLANKGPLVQAMVELLELTQPPNTGRLAYSATVCGGLPILNVIQRDMVVGHITKVQGVFNATSNFVLDALRQYHHNDDGTVTTTTILLLPLGTTLYEKPNESVPPKRIHG